MTTQPLTTPFDNPQTDIEVAALETLVANLRNAHALEKQVIAVLEAQLKVIDDYPDLHARVTQHIRETQGQTRRLELCLETCGSAPSTMKDMILSLMGLGQSSVQGFSEDAVLKAMAADMMTGQLEITTYRTLLVLADMADKGALRPHLEESLREEEAMAEWCSENLDSITRRFVEIRAMEGKAFKLPAAQVRDPELSNQPVAYQNRRDGEDV